MDKTEETEVTKVIIKMEIEVKDFEAFLTSSQLGLIKFAETTGANILKMEIKEK